jgi:hypothetical protein
MKKEDLRPVQYKKSNFYAKRILESQGERSEHLQSEETLNGWFFGTEKEEYIEGNLKKEETKALIELEDGTITKWVLSEIKFMDR